MARGPEANNSVFLRRLVSLLFGALLLSAGLTIAIYSFASNIVFSHLKSQEYTNRAALIAEQTADRYLGDLSVRVYDHYMKESPDLIGASILVYMYKGDSFERAYTPRSMNYEADFLAQAKAQIESRNYVLMDKRSVHFEARLGPKKELYLFVGYPILAEDVYSSNDQVIGAVYILGSMADISESYTSLRFALVLASSLAFLIVLLPLLYLSRRLIKPLVDTKNVALAMAKGDFSKRAQITSRDEIGDLATAVNDLADDLDKTLKNLTNERNRLKQILNGLNEGILALTKDLKLMHINPALILLFHLDESEDPEVLSRKVLALSKMESDLIQVLADGESKTLAIKHRGRHIQIQIDPLLDENNVPNACIALFRDTTEQDRLEQTRRDYVSNVSHELRTPLTAVRGLVEPLSDGIVKKEEDRMRYYGIILQETLRLSRLIDDMMALSRLQSGSVSVEPERISSQELLENISYKYESAMAEKDILFSIPSLAETNLPELYNNGDRIEQILVIYLDNAMKFTQPGKNIRVYLKPYKKDPDRMVFEVEDQGSGIDEEDIDRIFDRFYKVDKSRGRTDGTGLGLSIAKELSQQMGEEVWAESSPGQGSSFYLTVKIYKEGMEDEN